MIQYLIDFVLRIWTSLHSNPQWHIKSHSLFYFPLVARNIRGPDRLFVSGKHPSHDFLEALYEGGLCKDEVKVDTSTTQGMLGYVWCDEEATLSGK